MTAQEITDHLRSVYPTWVEMAELQQVTDAARERWRQRAESAEAALAAVPVEAIRCAMLDTTAQHYSWYQPIRRWLDSLEVQP